MAERDRLTRLEYDIARLSRQVAGLPVRIAETGGGEDNIPPQLAMITGLVLSGTTPHYDAPYDLTFTLPGGTAEAVAVYAVLLKTVPATALLGVYNPDGDTLDDLRFIAYDVRREGLPKVGDIVRAWNAVGSAIHPGDVTWVDGTIDETRAIYCEPINAVEELRGLDTWDLPTDQVLVHEADSQLLVWMEAEAFVSGPGGGTTGGGDTVVAGYGMDISGTGTVTIINDPTEWTGWDTTANTIQFFFHDDSATLGTVTDPSWKTVADSDTTKNQMWWRKGTSFVFETTTDYGGSATEPQFLTNWGAGNGGEWQWWSSTSFDSSDSTQLLGHVNGAGIWKTLLNWLNTHLTIELSLIDSDTKLEARLLVDGTEISSDSVDVDDCA